MLGLPEQTDWEVNAVKKMLLIPGGALLMLFLLAACAEAQPDGDHSHGGNSINSAPSLVEHIRREPADIQELVDRSNAVVVGSISSVGELVSEQPYNAEDFEDWPEDERPTRDMRYYGITIEEVLLDDGYVEDNARLRLAPIWPQQPILNERYIFVLSRNPDNLSYGISATWDILSLGGDAITDIAGKDPSYDGVSTETELLKALKAASDDYSHKPLNEWPDRFNETDT